MIWCLIAFLCMTGVGVAQDDAHEPNLSRLSRDERVRLLRQRSWEITAAPVQGRLEIDGRLDDPDWAMAAPASQFYQRERNEGLPATERTEVRVLYDSTNLYIGFRCYDKEPGKAKARAMFRDESAGADDLVSIMLDSYNDRRSAIQFVTNANGLMEDLFQTGESERTRNHNWDAVWNARGGRNPEGWEVEVAIPFKSLRFESPVDGEEVVFGIGFKRNIPRKNEEVYWPFVANDSSWYRPAELGRLRGLRGIEPGRSVELRPYALAGAGYNGDLARTDSRWDGGLDLKWGVTPGLTADFTVNTDFAQEEVDTQQLNFTRFSLFFPEKRQFFLEGERMFQFGLPRETDLVFTRRIGLSDEGAIIPILGGARLSGRQGRYSIGAMSIQTEAEHGLPSENFSVFRLRRDVFSRSGVGALFTSREGGGRFNRVAGADFNFLFRQVWTIEGFLAKAFEPGLSSGSHAGYFHFGYEKDRWGANYRYGDIGEDFRPGIGFVRRRDSRTNSGELRFSPRPGWEAVRQFDIVGSATYVADQENVLESRSREMRLSTNFETGDTLTVGLENQLEAIDSPFQLRTGVVVLPGTYRFNTLSATLNTFRRRHARVNLGYSTGGFWSGERDRLSADGGYRISRHFDLSGRYEINWVNLPEGKFTTHLVSTRLQVALRNDMAVNTLLQYNNDTKLFSSYVRFYWIVRPGSEFFVVYNETDRMGELSGVKNRSLSVKLNYLFAF
ncbi:MAG: DUF5916 domain-containing protein [Acidobacteriota bacterium]